MSLHKTWYLHTYLFKECWSFVGIMSHWEGWLLEEESEKLSTIVLCCFLFISAVVCCSVRSLRHTRDSLHTNTISLRNFLKTIHGNCHLYTFVEKNKTWTQNYTELEMWSEPRTSLYWWRGLSAARHCTELYWTSDERVARGSSFRQKLNSDTEDLPAYLILHVLLAVFVTWLCPVVRPEDACGKHSAASTQPQSIFICPRSASSSRAVGKWKRRGEVTGADESRSRKEPVSSLF